MILLLIFLAPHIVGLVLWRQRKLTGYQSLQIVLALSGLFGLPAIDVLDQNRLWLELQKDGAISKEMGYVLSSVTVLAVMAWSHLTFSRK